jgi:hypothetical protein
MDLAIFVHSYGQTELALTILKRNQKTIFDEGKLLKQMDLKRINKR